LAIEHEAFGGPKTILRKPLQDENKVHAVSESVKIPEKDLATIISEEMEKMLKKLTSEIKSLKSGKKYRVPVKCETKSK
jgi:hypothetical protein